MIENSKGISSFKKPRPGLVCRPGAGWLAVKKQHHTKGTIKNAFPENQFSSRTDLLFIFDLIKYCQEVSLLNQNT